MRVLLVMRHAKSSRDDPSLADHDRPLNDRGRRDAPLAGAHLAEAGLVPQRILASSALRARQTAQGVADAAGYRGSIAYLDELYAAAPPAYVTALRGLPPDVATALIVGHNPGVEDLVQLLTGRAVEMPTAALAHLTLDVDLWSTLPDRQTGRLIDVWRPKEARSGNSA